MKFPKYPVIGEEEKKAVMQVLNNGRLSYFLASPGEHFLGGPKVKELEELFKEYHDTNYAVAFNSATSALHAAVIGCDINQYDEVITTPLTFSSTATCIMMEGAKPVFADIKSDTYNIDPIEIEQAVNPMTKAIIPVHLFGQSCDMDEMTRIAQTYNLKIIEDACQAPGAKYRDKLVGTMGDCGVFSLTENKNITSGEGGVLITDDSHIAEVAQQVRNHGEVSQAKHIGYNYRMTEIAAAIGCEQFKKLDSFNDTRIKLTSYLSEKIKDIEGIDAPIVCRGNKHVFYVYAMNYSSMKMHKDDFVKKMNELGVPMYGGFKPLYHMAIYGDYERSFSYCHIAEECSSAKLVYTMVARPPATIEHMDIVADAIREVLE